MAEPLSITASTIAVVGLAAESSKFMFNFFHGIKHVPANVHDTSIALKSLHVTLTGLQEIGTKLDPKYKFSAHFCHRLDECLKELKTFEAKINKIHTKLDKGQMGKRNIQTRRTWRKVRWLLDGQQETKRFLEKVKIYQNEFFLELLGLLTIINGSPVSLMVRPGSVVKNPTTTESSGSTAVAQQLCQPLNIQEYAATEQCLTVDRLPLTASIWNAEGSAHPIESSKFVDNCDKFSEAAILGVPPLCFLTPSIRVAFIYRWSFILGDFAIRGGPAITLKLGGSQKAQSSARCRKTGIGIGFSLVMPNRCRRKLDIALYLVQVSLLSRMSVALQWDIEFPRIIPRRAEVMQCVDEGSVDGVRRLIGTGKATSRDITTNGTTLLHLASITSNLRMIQLLIQEGGDVNAQNEDGETPLHWAMGRDGNYEVARLLIENGADIANNTVDGSTPLHTLFNDTVGQILMRDDWIEDTLPNSEGMSIAHFLAWSSKSTSKLLKRGVRHTSAGLWSIDGFGRTCLHLAASRGNLDILRYLLEQASLSEVRRTDNEGQTALHYTMRNKRLQAVDVLMASGGDLVAKDNASRTVLHHAARWENLEAAQKVVALGDRKILLSPDKNGHMPSHLARGPKATAVREFLVGLESAANCGADSTRQHRLHQSSSIGTFHKIGYATLLSKQSCFCVITFAMLLSALELVSLRGIVIFVFPVGFGILLL